MSAQITAEEMFESLTGWDEKAIEKAFGGEVVDLASSKPTTFTRALVFIHVKRTEDLDDRKAKERVMGMSLGEAQSFFVDEDLESGEGEAPSE